MVDGGALVEKAAGVEEDLAAGGPDGVCLVHYCIHQLLCEVMVEPRVTSIKEGSDGMSCAQCSKCSQVNDLGNGVRLSEVEYLAEKVVVVVEHHLRKKPVVWFINRRVDEVAPHVGPDRQREEVAGLGTDVEVSGTGSCISSRLRSIFGLVGVVCEEKTTGSMQVFQGLARKLLYYSIIYVKRKKVIPRVETMCGKGADGEPLHGEKEVLSIIGEEAGGNSDWVR